MKTVSGLFLWEVLIDSKYHGGLWVTTKQDCMQTASRKAANFMKRHARLREVKINEIHQRGTLDC